MAAMLMAALPAALLPVAEQAQQHSWTSKRPLNSFLRLRLRLMLLPAEPCELLADRHWQCCGLHSRQGLSRAAHHPWGPPPR